MPAGASVSPEAQRSRDWPSQGSLAPEGVASLPQSWKLRAARAATRIQRRGQHLRLLPGGGSRELRPKPCGAARRGCLPTSAISARSSPTEEQGHAPSRPLALFIGERGGLAPFICPCCRLSLSDSLYAQDSREPLTICASARRAETGVTERRSRRAAPRFQMNVASWP